LTSEEADVLRRVLRTIAVRRRTGEVGVVNGVNRFVSTKQPLMQQDREVLNAVARKLGLTGITQYDGQGLLFTRLRTGQAECQAMTAITDQA
jgi:hypothetical protein